MSLSKIFISLFVLSLFSTILCAEEFIYTFASDSQQEAGKVMHGFFYFTTAEKSYVIPVTKKENVFVGIVDLPYGTYQTSLLTEDSSGNTGSIPLPDFNITSDSVYLKNPGQLKEQRDQLDKQIRGLVQKMPAQEQELDILKKDAYTIGGYKEYEEFQSKLKETNTHYNALNFLITYYSGSISHPVTDSKNGIAYFHSQRLKEQIADLQNSETGQRSELVTDDRTAEIISLQETLKFLRQKRQSLERTLYE